MSTVGRVGSVAILLCVAVLANVPAPIHAQPAAATAPGSPGGSAGQLILDDLGVWRAFYAWQTPLVRKAEGGELKEGPDSASYGPIHAAKSPPPPVEWIKPDFDDSAWAQLHNRRHGRVDYGFWDSSPSVSMQCLRGRFKVDDPAAVRGLKLTLTYRGGVVVYLNGKELARANMPKDGVITAGMLADDYPPDAFIRPDKSCISIFAIHDQGQFIRSDKEALAKRIREVNELELKPADLVKGVNVLALEFHRAPYFGNGLEKENGNHVSAWSTCGLVRLALRADAGVTANSARPKGVQIWPSSVLRRATPFDFADPLEKPAPLSIVGCRNGQFTGKVMITSDAALTGVKAAISDLAAKVGNTVIPAARAKVLYVLRDDTQLLDRRMENGFWDTLSETPPGQIEPAKIAGSKTPGGAIQPIIVKVAVPADAVPGDYAGKLTVTVNGAATDLPVRLRVVDFKLPDPMDYVTHMGIVESPESVALQYQVPLWSDEHFKLIEKSFQLLSELGNKYVAIPLIARTNFGNEQSMVRWVKDGDGYKYDFTVFDRYLDLAIKYQKMDVVCLYIWDRYTGSKTWVGIEPSTEPIVTRWDPATSKAEDMKAPKFDSPEGDKAWGPLLKETLAHIEKRGLGQAAMLGMNAEWLPTKEIAAAYLRWWPKAKWVSNQHADRRGDDIFGIPVAYNTAVYVAFCLPPGRPTHRAKGGRDYGWQTYTDLFPRGAATWTPLWPDAHPAAFRLIMEVAFSVNCSGLGRAGADFWPVLGRDFKMPPDSNSKRSHTVTARFPNSSWEQVNMDTGCEALLAPGPAGAVPTERYEQVREGVQDCEARVVIEKAILSGKLDAETVKRAWAVLDDRQWRIHSACCHWSCFEGAGAIGSAEDLYSMAGEVANKVGGK